MPPEKSSLPDRLLQQIQFVIEVDKLKHVYRHTILTDGSRYENDAEHSWHLALMAMLLSEYAADPHLDLLRAVQMVILHDLVEIDAGDTYCYDDQAARDKAERESRAADRLFNLLPPDQAVEFRSLWNEFEVRSTSEARFAAALDRLQPLLHNFATRGSEWRKHSVTRTKVVERNRPMAEGAPLLWSYAENLIDEAVRLGYLAGE
ncbi:MAG: HD domain-containing protein [Planctomycetes bacterium]|nr:HD domain-containing protein [Planctomycetota bacterium]